MAMISDRLSGQTSQGAFMPQSGQTSQTMFGPRSAAIAPQSGQTSQAAFMPQANQSYQAALAPQFGQTSQAAYDPRAASLAPQVAQQFNQTSMSPYTSQLASPQQLAQGLQQQALMSQAMQAAPSMTASIQPQVGQINQNYNPSQDQGFQNWLRQQQASGGTGGRYEPPEQSMNFGMPSGPQIAPSMKASIQPQVGQINPNYNSSIVGTTTAPSGKTFRTNPAANRMMAGYAAAAKAKRGF